MATALPRLAPDFVQRHKADRIVEAAARLLSADTYPEVGIAEIVKEARVARKTLYDNFDGKDAVARALVVRVSEPTAVKLGLGPGMVKDRPVAVLAVEIAARVCTDGDRHLGEDANHLLRALDEFDPTTVKFPAAGDPLRSTLPPGRHGLSPKFRADNQRQRLLCGFAQSMAELGFGRATIAHITRRAGVSRRTFYEHFTGKDGAATAFVKFAGLECPNPLLLPLAAEILGAGAHAGRGAVDHRVEEAGSVVAELATARARD